MMAEHQGAGTQSQENVTPPSVTPGPAGTTQAGGQSQAAEEKQKSGGQNEGEPTSFFPRLRLSGLFSKKTDTAEVPSPPESSAPDEERAKLISKHALELKKWMGSTVFSVGVLTFSMLFWTLLIASWVTWRWWFSMIIVSSHVIITALLALLLFSTKAGRAYTCFDLCHLTCCQRTHEFPILE